MLDRLARSASRRGSSRRRRRSTRFDASSRSTSPAAGGASSCKLDWSLIGPFARRVLRATAEIPYGGALTYAEVAADAGSPRGSRAAGNALGVQPDPDRHPLPPRAAHRRRARRLRRRPGPKRWLLELEGVPLPAPR